MAKVGISQWDKMESFPQKKATTFGSVKKALAISLVIISNVCFGQNSNWNVEAAPLGGFLMPHHDDMLYLIDGHVLGGELSFSKTVDGSEDWHHYFAMPRWGVSLNAYKLGSEYMGEAISGRLFFDLPTGKSRLFSLKISIGAGWIERPFDEDDNVRNSAIGSSLNASVGLEGVLNIPLNEKLVLTPGLGIHHYSNGAMKMPNSGINLAMLRVGLRFGNNVAPAIEDRKSQFEKGKSEFLFGISGGMKEIKPIGGEKYGIVNLFGIWQKRLSPKSTFGAELGVNYNESLQYRAQEDQESELDPSENYRFYVAGLYYLHFDPIKIRLSAGSYLAPNFTDDGNVFLRYHLMYTFGKFEIFTGLKTHYAKADNIELGMQYRIK